jgi:hypothetical protein
MCTSSKGGCLLAGRVILRPRFRIMEANIILRPRFRIIEANIINTVAIDGQTCVPCRHWHGHGRVVPRLSTTLPCWCAYRVVPRRAGVPASQPRHYTKEAGACRVVLLGTAAQQCPCQPRHNAGAQVQTKHRFTKCSNTKIHSFKVTTHKENTRLYIGGEGRPGSTIAREGQPGSNSYRACPVPAAGAGRARVVFACWDSSPTLARGLCRARHWHGTDRAVSFSGRV